ncbi:MAG: hypothetical protein Q9186_001177 [Xanthomendoza sp. 1 TL-2023]
MVPRKIRDGSRFNDEREDPTTTNRMIANDKHWTPFGDFACVGRRTPGTGLRLGPIDDIERTKRTRQRRCANMTAATIQ